MRNLNAATKTRALNDALPWVLSASPTSVFSVALSILAFASLRREAVHSAAEKRRERGSPIPEKMKDTVPIMTRRLIRGVTALLAALFLLSSALNLGAKFAQLSFSSPSTSIAEFEVVIALALIASGVLSSLYAYAGAYLFASVGIAEGLLSPGVQGLARSLHETMIPFAAAGWILLAVETRSVQVSRARAGQTHERRELLTALQFFVGALVTLGGVGYASTATYPVGTALGLIHLSVGLTGLFAAYAFLKRKPYSPRFLIAINLVTIVYSAFSESAAEVYPLMTPGIGDALIGTIIAIIVSSVIIYLLIENKATSNPLGAPK